MFKKDTTIENFKYNQKASPTMQIVLVKKPKNPTIIEGFPGFGLVGTISTEFLLDHLQTEKIGKILLTNDQPMVAIHQGEVVEPLGIFHNKKYNLVIIHAISAAAKHEYEMADTLNQLAKQLGAKEIISIEGVGAGSAPSPKKDPQVFHYTNNKKNVSKFQKIGIPPLQEGIIIGVTGAILLRVDAVPVTCLFAETKTKLPDSKAAAQIIKALDNYLGLKIDYKPLLDQAKDFEQKLQNIMQQGKQAQELSDKKRLDYMG